MSHLSFQVLVHTVITVLFVVHGFCPSFTYHLWVRRWVALFSLLLSSLWFIFCYPPSPKKFLLGKRSPPFLFCPHPFYISTLFSEKNVNSHPFTNFQNLRPAPFKKHGLPTVQNWSHMSASQYNALLTDLFPAPCHIYDYILNKYNINTTCTLSHFEKRCDLTASFLLGKIKMWCDQAKWIWSPKMWFLVFQHFLFEYYLGFNLVKTPW